MISAVLFFAWLAALVFTGYIALSIVEAVREYRQDKWARGNWALRFWWRYLSGTHAARQRRWEFVAACAFLLVIPGLPLAWVGGAFVAWQSGHLEAYMEWTQNGVELAEKGLKVVEALRK